MAKLERVLAIGAHPDDVEIGCGGTLALFAKMGVGVSMVSLCLGDKGSRDLSRDETIRVRQQESENAARIIGATYTSLGFSDSELMEDLQSRTQVIELIRSVRPELIITHSPTDYHADHCTTSALATKGAYIATSYKFETTTPPLPSVPPVYLMDNHLAMDFSPEEYVNITGVIDTKKHLIGQHESQFVHLRDRAGENILEDALLVSRLRGRQCGVEHAEAFRLFRRYPHAKSYRLLP